MSELLRPNLKDIVAAYAEQFLGMTDDEVSLEQLTEVQATLPTLLRRALDEDERKFLLSLKRGDPEWGRLGIEHAERLPALMMMTMTTATHAFGSRWTGSQRIGSVGCLRSRRTRAYYTQRGKQDENGTMGSGGRS